VPRTFDCPKCGAPVSYSSSAAGQDPIVKCNYCNSSLTEPNEMLGRSAHVVTVKMGRGGKNLKWIWLILILPLLGLVVGFIFMVLGLSPFFRSTVNKNAPLGGPTTSVPKRPVSKEPGAGLVTELLKFGTEGIGPGMFSDARSIALDGSGNIYVGEYLGGRIQVFDSSGKFLTQWSVDPKMPLRGMGANRKGDVYVVQRGEIVRYQGASGKQLGALEYTGGGGFDDVTAAADGGLVCAWYGNRDDIVHFDAAGKVVRTIKAAISSASGDSELNTRVALDGLGNIYALGTFNNAVFKFGPDGKFVNRFGGHGNQPGQLSAASAIAVDGLGRVYVSDSKGVQIFDSDGRYLNVFKTDGYASGMVFNDRNELFVAARTKVIKLALAQ
jgi:hypothetical protein